MLIFLDKSTLKITIEIIVMTIEITTLESTIIDDHRDNFDNFDNEVRICIDDD